MRTEELYTQYVIDQGYLVPKKKRRRGTAATQHPLGRPEYERRADYDVFKKSSLRLSGSSSHR